MRWLATWALIIPSVAGAMTRSPPPIADAILARAWKAYWIACAGAPEREVGVYRFRKVLDLAQKPDRFVVHVSGDQRFILYVNGERIGAGPARGDRQHWRFETFDVGTRLHPGRNLLVATVWNFGSFAPAAQVSDRTGFVLQGDTEAEQTANTDSSWECAPEPGHQVWPEGMAALKRVQYYVAGPGERIDASLYDWNWQRPPDDGGSQGRWQPAIEQGHPSPRTIREGPAYGLSPEGRWLVPDPLPQMASRPAAPGVVRTSSGVRLDGFPDSGKATIAARTRASLLLDRKELVAGYPELTVSGGRGARVRLTYQEGLVEDRFTKGDRNDIEGKRMLGLSDELLPDGNSSRTFRPLWWRTWRFLQLDVETADQPLSLDRLTVDDTGYPFEQRARFDAGDERLERVWATGWRTALRCAHETYVDCPYYEQLQYAGDTRVQALISYVVAGDDRLARQAIDSFDQSRRSEGIISSRYPTSEPQYIPPFALLWVGMVHDFWRYRDDAAFVAQKLPGIRSVLDFYQSYQRPDGLLGRIPFWNFLDWSPDFEEGVPPQDRDGGSAPLTLQMVAALREAAEMEEAVGDRARALALRERAARAASAVWRLCWNAQRGLVADTPARSRLSQQTNALALWLDVVPANLQREVLQKTLSSARLSLKPSSGGTITAASYYFRFYLARALDHLGRGDDYLDLLEPWQEMIDLGLSTFAETPDLASRSDCHAWSAHPTYDLLTITAGIRPAAPGFRKVRVEPHLGRLDHLDARMPHPSGDIAVSYRREADTLKARVVLPDGVTGEIAWRAKVRPLRPGSNEIELE
jgi:alpha-L-rhamnosidase